MTRSTATPAGTTVAFMDAIQLVEISLAETAKRVAKLRHQLAVAEEELRRLEITGETLARLSLNPKVVMPLPRGQSYTQVLAVLGETEDDAKSPREIYDALVAGGTTNVSQENVRTILARRKEHIASSDGRYWRRSDLEEFEPSNGETEDGSETALEAQQKEDTEC